MEACCLREEDRELAYGWLPSSRPSNVFQLSVRSTGTPFRSPFGKNFLDGARNNGDTRRRIVGRGKQAFQQLASPRKRQIASGIAFIRSIRLERPCRGSTIARSTVMAHSALREEIQRKPMASPVSVALMTPAKLSGETRQGVVGCRFVATPNYRSTYSISIGSPLSSLAGTPRMLASCELDAELVTNAASASRTSSADTFLRGSSASTKSKKRSEYGSNAARTANRSRRPSFCLLLCFIGERPASAQKQTSGWTSRTSAPGPGLPRSKSSTSRIFRHIPQLCSDRLRPSSPLFSSRATPIASARTAMRHGTGNTLERRSPRMERAKRSHGRIGSSRHGRPMGTSIKTRSAFGNALSNSLAVLAIRYVSSPSSFETAIHPALQPSTPMCRMFFRRPTHSRKTH